MTSVATYSVDPGDATPGVTGDGQSGGGVGFEIGAKVATRRHFEIWGRLRLATHWRRGGNEKRDR